MGRSVLLILLCWLMSGCSQHLHTVKRGQLLMGTLVQVTAMAPEERTAAKAAAAALSEIRRLEGILSTWIPSSDLSRVNATSGLAAVHVGPEAFYLVDYSLRIAAQTDHAFNIAIGPVIEAWNVNEQGRIPDQTELDRLRNLIDISNIQLNETERTIFLTQPGMRIDVGGIGKGFAADRAVSAMQAAGATAGVVALSGDIKTFGKPPDQASFVFGIQHPRKEQALLGRLELHDEAISTAGDYERYFERDGIRYHHILDPRTLQPARECQSVTIVARDGIMADGLDTGIFVLGPERGMALIERLPDVEGIIVDSAGKLWISTGLQHRLMIETASGNQEFTESRSAVIK